MQVCIVINKKHIMQQTESNEYAALLLSEEWQTKRKTILERDGNKCRNCGSQEALQVHHRQYHINLQSGEKLPPWQYNGRYLITLCSKCHQTGHENYQVPTKFI